MLRNRRNMSHINKIYEALLNRKEKVCSKSEILAIIDEYNHTFGKINLNNALKYLSRHHYIKRIILQYYYINSLDEKKRHFCKYEDKELLFLVLHKLKVKWYIGLHYALYLLGKRWQGQNTLTIINNKLRGNKSVFGLKVRFLKVKWQFMIGINKDETKNNVTYFYSNLAKTYLDLVYFKESQKLIRTKNTSKYLKIYPKWLQKT